MKQPAQDPSEPTEPVPDAPRGGNGADRDPPPERQPLDPRSLLRLAAVFYAILLAAALSWAAFSGRSLLYASGRAELRGIDWSLDAAAGLLAGAIVVLLSREVTLRTRWGADLAAALAALLGPLSLRTCLALAALSSVGEEAFFRGALQPHVGLVWASLLFGLAHLAPRRELWPWTFFSVAAGFLLGGLFELTGNLVAPILAHAFINAVNLRLLALRYAP